METSMICALPDDLLLRILHRVPTKDAIATSILSQRWRYVWTMLHTLEFKGESISESVESLQLHKASRLHKLVENAVNRCVKYLGFKLLRTAEPTRLPKSLYTCETLVYLTLSNKILVDVSSPARLPSLKYLILEYVVYKDEDSLDRLLSSSPVLKSMMVRRHKGDNLKTFAVKVSSLERLHYTNSFPKDEDDLIGSLVIDSPALRKLNLWNLREDYCLIENMHCLDEAFIGFVSNPDVKILRSLSSVKHMYLNLTKSLVPCCYATIKFFGLIEFFFLPYPFLDWLEPFIFFLQNSPKLKTLTIDTINNKYGGPSPSWNQPSTIPECLLTHLEVFRWKDYGGREGEKQLLTYILANSKCLKTVKISFKATCNFEEIQKEIESMPRTSTSSRLLFSPKIDCCFN